MVEQLTVNQPVVGSNPASGAIQNKTKKPPAFAGGFFSRESVVHTHYITNRNLNCRSNRTDGNLID